MKLFDHCRTERQRTERQRTERQRTERQRTERQRTERQRTAIVNHYRIRQVGRYRLLPGQSKRSFARDNLTDEYFCFSFQANDDETDKGTFICGRTAAGGFLALVGDVPMRAFNPLMDEYEPAQINADIQRNNVALNPDEERQPPPPPPDPLVRQLSDAINIIILYWDEPPKPALASIKLNVNRFYIEEYKRYELDNCIKGVNKIISYDRQGYKLSDMVNNLRSKYPNMREYKFELIHERYLQLVAEKEKPPPKDRHTYKN